MMAESQLQLRDYSYLIGVASFIAWQLLGIDRFVGCIAIVHHPS